MYNATTEQKIKNIPNIGKINTDRLPQELTKIYAQIISFRQKHVDGRLVFQSEELRSSLKVLNQLSSNLETILLTTPDHVQKESIAFVAATAYKLTFEIGIENLNKDDLFNFDSISPYVSSVILFLIANSQADAAEVANLLSDKKGLNVYQKQLTDFIISLASGRLSQKPKLLNEPGSTNDIPSTELALNLMWYELSKGINYLIEKLLGKYDSNESKHFQKVEDLSIQYLELFQQSIIVAGPNRLAKLLNITEKDIFKRAVVTINSPKGVDPTPWMMFLETIAKERPFLWENHTSAIETGFLTPGISTILTLPTGAGKSTLSELKLASCIFSGKQAIYLVPTHALEDQIKKNLKKLFSTFDFDSVESDGEYTELEDSDNFPILVMTPEKCLTLISTKEEYIRTIGLIVFDEFHLIHGSDLKKDRRAIDAMFCLTSLLTICPQADYLLISAMVENGADVASWISEITKRECLLFNSSWKPTRQLHGCLVFNDSEIKQLNRHISISKSTSNQKGPGKKLKDSLNAEPMCIFSMKNIWETTNDQDYYVTRVLDSKVKLSVGISKTKNWYLTSNRNEVAARLAIHFANLGLKTIVFVDNPIVANSTAKIISQGIENKSNYSEFLLKHKLYIDRLSSELGGFGHSFFHTFQNVSVHHGQLLPIERYLIEQYFKNSSGANALVATATLAQGINLPAEIVIIAGDDRFDEDGNNRERVKPHELLNAAGRAGRAGLSSQGAVILIPGEIVKIEEMTISNRWWELKNEVFSKGDQCLKIEDPLGYFLDSIMLESMPLETNQINILYRFKSNKLPLNDSEKIVNNTFYAHKIRNEGKSDLLSTQINQLIKRRNELDRNDESINWINEVSYKLGLDPSIIVALNKDLELEGLLKFCSKSIEEIIKWFFAWLKMDETYLKRIFSKSSSINNIKKVIGLKYEVDYSVKDILEKIDTLVEVLIGYIKGIPLNELDKMILDSGKGDGTPYLKKARHFMLKVVPELSYSFGIITMVIIEQAKQNKISKKDLPMNIRTLASCIREGLDDSEKLFFKRAMKLEMRVETHLLFNAINFKNNF